MTIPLPTVNVFWFISGDEFLFKVTGLYMKRTKYQKKKHH